MTWDGCEPRGLLPNSSIGYGDYAASMNQVVLIQNAASSFQ
jgi:hypothetical protein